MTLREWYAGMVLQGMIAGRYAAGVISPDSQTERNWTAETAFAYADAMIAALGKDKSPYDDPSFGED